MSIPDTITLCAWAVFLIGFLACMWWIGEPKEWDFGRLIVQIVNFLMWVIVCLSWLLLTK